MSRNFELLQQVGKERDILEAPVAGTEPELGEGVPAVTSPALHLDKAGSEEIRNLVQRVFLLPGGQAPHTVVFAGSEPGDGCSWICARAAEALACQVSGSVCLVDANLRAPGLHEHALGAVSDGAVLVLKANSSRKETARNAVQELQTAKVRVLGAVLNQRTFPIPDAIYNRL